MMTTHELKTAGTKHLKKKEPDTIFLTVCHTLKLSEQVNMVLIVFVLSAFCCGIVSGAS